MAHAAGRERYHHGDAPNALIASASDLLETVGAAGLSLRQVAEQAGLSRQAPYNHFADKQALLAELVRGGFERLRAAVATAGGSSDALERTAEAYIAFAQTAPALFRLMFSRELVDLSRFPAAAEAAAATFGEMSAVVATVVEEGDVPDLSLAAWCLVHGYASLCIETGLEPQELRSARARLFAKVIRTSATSERA
jgi:AcrR family transcriptional regulator